MKPSCSTCTTRSSPPLTARSKPPSGARRRVAELRVVEDRDARAAHRIGRRAGVGAVGPEHAAAQHGDPLGRDRARRRPPSGSGRRRCRGTPCRRRPWSRRSSAGRVPTSAGSSAGGSGGSGNGFGRRGRASRSGVAVGVAVGGGGRRRRSAVGVRAAAARGPPLAGGRADRRSARTGSRPGRRRCRARRSAPRRGSCCVSLASLTFARASAHAITRVAAGRRAARDRQPERRLRRLAGGERLRPWRGRASGRPCCACRPWRGRSPSASAFAFALPAFLTVTCAREAPGPARASRSAASLADREVRALLGRLRRGRAQRERAGDRHPCV